MAATAMDRYSNGHLTVPSEEQSSRLASPERGSRGQSPVEGPKACHEQPLDFSCRATASAVVAGSDDEDCKPHKAAHVRRAYEMDTLPHLRIPSPSPSTTPSEPTPQAFRYPLHDAMKSFGSSTVTNETSPATSPRAEEHRYRSNGDVPVSTTVDADRTMLPSLLQTSPAALKMGHLSLFSNGLAAYDTIAPLARPPPPQQPAFPTSVDPSLMAACFPSSTARTPKSTRPFKLYTSNPHGLPLFNIASQIQLPTPELLNMQQLADDPLYKAFKAEFTRTRPEPNNRRSRATSANCSAASPNSATSPPPRIDSSPPDNASGSVDSRYDSGDEADPLLPENSSSSFSPVANDVAGGSGSVNGATAQGDSTAGPTRRRGRVPADCKDQAYWERRKKNNEAAKRSRDARRAKEDEIAIRAAYYQQENMNLRLRLAEAVQENGLLRAALYQRM